MTIRVAIRRFRQRHRWAAAVSLLLLDAPNAGDMRGFRGAIVFQIVGCLPTPVVGHGHVAADDAAPAVFHFCIRNRQTPSPFAEGNARSNLFFLWSRMDFVAGFAAPPLVAFITGGNHMEVMKVKFTVSELGEGFGHFVLRDVGFVTLKTKAVA